MSEHTSMRVRKETVKRIDRLKKRSRPHRESDDEIVSMLIDYFLSGEDHAEKGSEHDSQ